MEMILFKRVIGDSFKHFNNCYIQIRTKKHFVYKYSPIRAVRRRRELGLPGNPNASGVLTDGPDFSYMDGRITPLGDGQKKRLLQNEQAKLKIMTLSKEIDFAVERFNLLQNEAMKQKQTILNEKLKEKGTKLLRTE